MPYIKKDKRKLYDPMIQLLVTEFLRQKIPSGYSTPPKYSLPVGDINYVVSSILFRLFEEESSYTRGNEIVGAVECIKQEFIHRILNCYEDEKIKENGDI